VKDNNLIYKIDDKYKQYLIDESKLAGKADTISFPQSEKDILEIIKIMGEKSIPITIQGSRTGIVGCAVPVKGHILNMSKMNKIKDVFKNDVGKTYIKVEPGLTLFELNEYIQKLKNDEKLFWPPDPTETSATLGGIVSCDAKGISYGLYGDTRKYVKGIRVILSNGEILEITRGEKSIFFYGGSKDLIDVFLGGEGMYGIITELTLELIPKPKEIWGISFFFEEKTKAFKFIKDVLNLKFEQNNSKIAAIEYMDRNTLNIIDERRNLITALKSIPPIDKDISCMIYIEIHGDDDESVEAIAETLMNISIEVDCDPDKTWAVNGDSEIEKMRNFRHAAPEAINLYIDHVKNEYGKITKLGTDISIKNETFDSIINNYENYIEKEGLKACIFGHVRENHLHVNILPSNYLEYEKGLELIKKWSKKFANEKEIVFTENGVGKLKKEIFLDTTEDDYVEEIRRLKKQYDPLQMWNPENMID
jgi:D-lactate dehydrogenase (cytochrome)